MNEHIQEQGASRGNGMLLGLAVALVLAGVVAFYLLADHATWVRWVAVLAGFVAGGAVFAASGTGRDFRQFAVDARNELRKVVWPAKNETWMTTAVVFGFAIVAGLFFWTLDLFLAWATRLLTGQGA
ncbi:MAG: preprotein translocase subunit SecE [Pseudomonadota bacterium]|jgi:preprotein translocase subunit SecE